MMKQHVVLPAADSVAELRQNLLPQPLRETLVSSVGMRTLLRDEVRRCFLLVPGAVHLPRPRACQYDLVSGAETEF